MNLKMTKFALSISLTLCSLVACGDDVEIADQTLTGTINGESWTFVQGRATNDDSDGTVSVAMYPFELEDPCGFPTGEDSDRPKILMIRNAEVNETEMSLQYNLTFAYDGSQNDIATEGLWRFDSVTDETITGGVNATMGDHEVNGTFELTRCPDPFPEE